MWLRGAVAHRGVAAQGSRGPFSGAGGTPAANSGSDRCCVAPQAAACNHSATGLLKRSTAQGQGQEQQGRALASSTLGLGHTLGSRPATAGHQLSAPLPFPWAASRSHTALRTLAGEGQRVLWEHQPVHHKRLHAADSGARVIGGPREGATACAESPFPRAVPGMAQGSEGTRTLLSSEGTGTAHSPQGTATVHFPQGSALQGRTPGAPAERDGAFPLAGNNNKAAPPLPQAELRHSPGAAAQEDQGLTAELQPGAAPPREPELRSASAAQSLSAGNGACAEAASAQESRGKEAASGSVWRRHVESLLQGTRWVGALDPMVSEVLHEVVSIEEHFLAQGYLWPRASQPAPAPAPAEEGAGVEGRGERGGGGESGEEGAGVEGRGERGGGGESGEEGAQGQQGGGGKKRRSEQREAPVSCEDDFYQGPVSAELDRRFKERYESAHSQGGEFLHRSFASRQVATKLLLNLPELCHGCWLPHEDCMCAALEHAALPSNIVLWVYLHPKEFLMKNNTGKLLWQVLGPSGARLCVSGIQNHEEAMFDALMAGGSFWCLYPARGGKPHTAASIPLPWASMGAPSGSTGSTNDGTQAAGPTHFIIVDGTWNTSRAMVTRLQEQLELRDPQAWLNFVQLAEPGPSVMHNLRIQPTKEKICTAAAASRLLVELSERQDLPQEGALLLGKASKAIDGALAQLLSALAKRRMRTGLSGTRLGVGTKNHGYLQDRKRT